MVGFQEVAGRDCIEMDVYKKKDNSLVFTVIVDIETNHILKEYRYDSEGNIIASMETLEIDYDPNLSVLEADGITNFGVEFDGLIYTAEEFAELVPWINLTSLPLPEGFQVIGFAEIISVALDIESEYITESITETKDEHQDLFLIIIVSDGLNLFTIQIQVPYLTEDSIKFSDEIILAIAEYQNSTIGIVFDPTPIVIMIEGDFMTHEQRTEVIQSLTNIDNVNSSDFWLQYLF